MADGFPVVAALLNRAPAAWNGAPMNLSDYGSLTLFCTAAPGAPRKVQISPDWNGAGGTWFDLAITGAAGTATQVAALGLFTGRAGGWIRLDPDSAAAGGTFYLGAGS